MSDELYEEMVRRIGAHIRKLREEHGLTQEQLANEVQCSRHSIGDVESGRSPPSIRVLAKFAAVLKVEPVVFFGPIESNKRPTGRPRSK